MKYNFTIVVILCMLAPAVYSQKDSILLKNHDIIVGKIEKLEKGVLTFETEYSDSDFKIEWTGISEIHAQNVFLITTSGGYRYKGRLVSVTPHKVLIIREGNDTTETPISEIVLLNPLEQGFWSRLYASVDIGYNFTKANNLQQFSINGNIGYLADRWSTDISASSLGSTQDEAEDISRTDGAWTFRYYLPKDWYAFAQTTVLSNTEQKLDRRTNGNLGFGKFVIHTNYTYWGFRGGASFNNEKYSNEEELRNNLEVFLGSELNMFDVGDLSLLTNINAFTSLTSEERWRIDYKIDFKYDLPLDFYIKLGFTLNWDTQPAEGAGKTDYVFKASFGWEL